MTGASLARDLAARAIRYSGIPRAARFARRASATILFYHDPSPAAMDAHLGWFGARFRFTTLDHIVDGVRDRKPVPAGSLAITLDDGYRGNHALLPVFRHHGVRPTIYLCSAIVATKRRFWFQEPVDTERAKRLSNRERLAWLERATGFRQESEATDGARVALDAREIAEMAAARGLRRAHALSPDPPAVRGRRGLGGDRRIEARARGSARTPVPAPATRTATTPIATPSSCGARASTPREPPTSAASAPLPIRCACACSA